MIDEWDALRRLALRRRPEDLIEREEMLIARITAREPRTVRELAGLVVVAADGEFRNRRVVGPLVLYSLRACYRIDQ